MSCHVIAVAHVITRLVRCVDTADQFGLTVGRNVVVAVDAPVVRGYLGNFIVYSVVPVVSQLPAITVLRTKVRVIDPVISTVGTVAILTDIRLRKVVGWIADP
jgi:hypothetical protein